MELPVIITLIICGTVVAITMLALLFTMWVINKGVEIEKIKSGR